MELIKMVNELNVNQKVGRICIGLSNDNPINEEIIRMVIDSCHNLYDIYVEDKNDSVDNIMHN